MRPAVKTPKKGNPKAASGLGSPATSSPSTNLRSSPRAAAAPSSLVHSSQVFGSARKKTIAPDDSTSEAGSEDDDDAILPVRKLNRGQNFDAHDAPISGPTLDSKHDSEEEEKNDDEDDDDKPLATPTPRRKRHVISDDSDEEEPHSSIPIKRRRLVRRNAASSPVRKAPKEVDDDDELAPASARATRTRRKPLTQKEKARELLRRKRAGEVINEEEEGPSSSDEEPAKAMYDTDSDHLALDEFEDDEEGVLEPTAAKKKGKKPKKANEKKSKTDEADSDTSMDKFVVDDDSDAPLGVPDEVYSSIPLEFTSHSHKPLKDHFRDAIEWLVQFKINPGFADKEHSLYRIAWKKLDDEVRGLATSKFASAAWKKDFYMTLRARPLLTSVELGRGGLLNSENCGACGRSGHPAK